MNHDRVRLPGSLRSWLSRWLATLTFLAIGFICSFIYIAISIHIDMRQSRLLDEEIKVVQRLFSEYAENLDTRQLQHSLNDFFYGHTDFALILQRNGGTEKYGGSTWDSDARQYHRYREFPLRPPGTTQPPVHAQLQLNTSGDEALKDTLAWTLGLSTLAGALAAFCIGHWLSRKALAPIGLLVEQASNLHPQRIGDRLDGTQQAKEIRPLVAQFNHVLQRVEDVYTQMIGFNADVAHELRTPLATLTGETELALSSKLDAESLRDVLGSNLEELQRLTSIVRDMLFLSQADQGTRARASWCDSLCQACEEVVCYHEAAALEAGVHVSIHGDASALIDRSLFQRAISNLLSNAIRYAHIDTVVRVDILQPTECEVSIQITNEGRQIDPRTLHRFFSRFYRVDGARSNPHNHYGLGLAIVDAIAKMHGGRGHVFSNGKLITVGFTLTVDVEKPQESGQA